MIFEKPEWVKHEKQGRDVELCPLLSVDIDSSGERLATAASDNKVRIWAMGPILDSQKEMDPAVPKLLATLTDHFEPVNVARFSPDGKLIASGSDSRMVVINQLAPGPASVRFGDKDAPSVENWKQVHVLRGHKSNVSDLSWSPDGKRIASASFDNLVIVWDVASGRQVAVLEGHHGLVKGVAWDPFNMYIATQGEMDGVFIWRVGDWSLVEKVQTEYSSTGNASLQARLSWSPDGQCIAGPCMMDKSTNVHLAILIRRNTWEADHQFVGHRLPVSVAKFNPCHFYPRKVPGSEEAVMLCALGSCDKKVTLWSAVEATPILQAVNKLFRQAVMDITWMPDGMGMVACSADGSIAVFQFEELDLGKKVPKPEVDHMLRSLGLQGDLQGRQHTLLAGPELLQLQEGSPSARGPHTKGGEGVARAGGAAPPSAPSHGGVAGASSMASMGKLSARLGPASGMTDAGFAAPTPGPGPAAVVGAAPTGQVAGAAGPSQPPPRPMVTIEGGRKRVAPMPVGEATQAQHAARTAQYQAGTPGSRLDSVPSPPLQRRPPSGQHASGPGPVHGAGGRGGGDKPAAKRQALQPAQLPTTAGAAPFPQLLPAGGAVVLGGTAGGGGAATAAGPLVLPPPPVVSVLHVPLGVLPGGEEGGTGGMVALEAANTVRDHRGRPAARLVCSGPGGTVWHDSVQGCVVQGAGGPNFSAISTSTGDLLLYSPAGRRMLPPIQLGCCAVVMAVGGWRLMVLTTDGRVRVWDVQLGKLTLEADAGPLLRGPAAVEGSLLTARLTGTGVPLLIMRNHHAYTYHTGWACWMRVADDAFPASPLHTSFSSNQGLLGRVQAEVASARQPRDVLAAANQPAEVQKRAVRAHLESNVASALALQSPQEWRRWLVTYVRQLATDEDEARLKEVLNDLLGPVRWSPATHGIAAAAGRGWDPMVMGLDKRQVLRLDILREVARVRSPGMQALATEMLEALKEAEATAAAAAAAPAAPAGPVVAGLGAPEPRSMDGLLGGGFGSQLAGFVRPC